MSGGSDLSQFGKPMARDHSEAAIRKAFRRKWTFWAVFVGVVAIGAGLYAWSSYLSDQSRALTTKYLVAQSTYEAELENFSKTLEKSQNLENVADLKPDFSKSTPMFAEFASANPNHPLGWQAALRVAQEKIKSKEFAEGVEILKPLLKQTRRFPIFQVKVRRTIAGVYAELGDYPLALAELELIEQVKENPSKDGTLLFKAQLLYLSGDKEGAKTLLTELSDGRVGEVSVAQDISTDAGLWIEHWKLN